MPERSSACTTATDSPTGSWPAATRIGDGKKNWLISAFMAGPPGETMKIAQVAPLYEAVPPRLYGGTERVVARLTNALVEQGHDVTLFAAGDMRTQATPIFTRRQALRLDDAPLKSDLASHLS